MESSVKAICIGVRCIELRRNYFPVRRLADDG